MMYHIDLMDGPPDLEAFYDQWAQEIADKVDQEALEGLLGEIEGVAERYPHTCPRCAGPAYVGLSDVDCLERCQ